MIIHRFRLFVAASICAMASLVPVQSINAALVLDSLGAEIADEFDSFRGDGLAPNPTATQLDSDTYRVTGFSDGDSTFGGTFTTGDFARGTSTGAVSTGGAYGFDLGGGNFGVGVQPAGSDFNPGTFTVRISNQTGFGVPALRVSADGFFFNDADRSTLWTFAISADDTNYFDFFTIASDLAADTNPDWDQVAIGGVIPFGVPIPNNTDLFVRVTGSDNGGSGARDQFALGRIAVTAVPEPHSLCLIAIGGLAMCVRRSRKRR